MFRLFEKIKHCRFDLINWNRATFRNTCTRLDQKQHKLAELTKGGYSANLDKIIVVKKDINELLHHEEVFWKQRSRSIWLPASDKNTKYFHQRASHKPHTNHIEGLLDDYDAWQIEGNRIEAIAEDYYRELFTTSNPVHMDNILNSVNRVVTEGMNETLTQPYTEDEVRQALFQMHPSKTPGLDGMSPFFFLEILAYCWA